MRLSREAWRYIAAVAVLALTGCHSAPTHIYTLYAIKPEQPASVYSGAVVRVDAVHIPPSLDRLQLTTSAGEGRLTIHDSEHWAGPLGQLAQVALSLDLAARLPAGRVIAPRLDKPEGATGLIVDIEELSDDGHSARLTASWTLRKPDDLGPVRGPVSSQVATGSETQSGRLSLLLAQLADRIATELAVPAQ